MNAAHTEARSLSRTWMQRLPASLRLAAAFALITAVILLPAGHWRVYAAIAGALVVIAAAARVSMLSVLKRLALLEPIIIGVAALSLLGPAGLRGFLSILAKSSLCLFVMILLSTTTRFTEILRVLRAIHTPWLLLTTLTLMYRYIFVLAEEGHRMRRARLSRTFNRGRWRTWKNLGTVIAQLFVRSSERAERIYAAMCARGWK